MPITPISLAGRLGSLGSYYACSDYTSTNPEFGSVDDFRNLVKKAQTSGFKVIIDWVANHTGFDHHWTKDHPEYYMKNEKGEFYDSHGWQDVIDLNYYNGALRESMIAAMKFWVNECNIDGFRCDMAHLVPLDFWREARTQLDELKPLFWLAECEVPTYHQVFDASYTWTWMHKSQDFAKGKISLADLKNVLLDDAVKFPSPASRVWFTSNHDENSWNGTEYEKYGDAAKPLAVFSATWKGIPLIYSGQELPNQKRLKFFDKDVIEWKEECALESFYKFLLALRKKQPALGARPETESFLITTSSDQQVLAFITRKDANQVLVLLNLSSVNIEGALSDVNVSGKFKEVISGKQVDFSRDRSMQLKPWEYMIFVK
jgi:glycosidase